MIQEGIQRTGDEEASRDMIFHAVREDAVPERKKSEKGVGIGGEQYRMLRRFIEDNLTFLNNHVLLGQISQALHYGLDAYGENQ